MKIYKIIILAFIMSLSFSVHAQIDNLDDAFFDGQRALMKQYPVPELTQLQMYEDFDSLISIMKNCYPQILVCKQVTGYDILGQMEALRKDISQCTHTLDFIRILKKAMLLTQDAHCYIGQDVYWFKNYHYKDAVKRLNIGGREYGYNFHYAKSVFYYIPQISLFYNEGKSFLKYDVEFYGEDTLTIPRGSEIISYNGQNIIDYLNTSRTYEAHWDFQRKQYYHEILEINSDKNHLSIKIDNAIKEIIFTKFIEQIQDDQENFFKKRKRCIHYFSKDSILYIKLPAMAYGKKLKKLFRKELWKYKQYPYQSIIIDIRGNEGGNDMAWIDLLACIIDKPIKYTWHLVANNTEQAKHVLKLTHNKKREPFQVEHTKDYYCTYGKEIDEIKSARNNLKHKGDIFILVDEDIFSSAKSFASMAGKTDRIKTIGIPTGQIGGQGITPSVFLLPHSRLMFTLDIIMDASGVNTFEDFYHDKVTYPVVPSVDYYLYWYNPERGYEINEKAMYEHDEIFLKALEIIKQEQNKNW